MVRCVLGRRLELHPTRAQRVDASGRASIVATGENRTAWLLLFEARLVKTLRCHVEVLHFKLFDPLTKYSVHLSHMDQLVVDFIDPASVLSLGRIRLLGLLLDS